MVRILLHAVCSCGTRHFKYIGSECRLVNDYIFKCNLLAFCYASRGQRYVLNLLSDVECGMRSSGIAAYFSRFTNPLYVYIYEVHRHIWYTFLHTFFFASVCMTSSESCIIHLLDCLSIVLCVLK
jgi:hypothetical protein